MSGYSQGYRGGFSEAAKALAPMTTELAEARAEIERLTEHNRILTKNRDELWSELRGGAVPSTEDEVLDVYRGVSDYAPGSSK